jgi:hypothetical protein
LVGSASIGLINLVIGTADAQDAKAGSPYRAAAKSGFGSIGKSMDESNLVRSPKTRAGVGIAILWPNTNRSP